MDQEPFQSLPRGWGIATLDEVALWGSGGTPSRKNPKFYEGSIPWVKTGELGPKYIRSAEEHITQEAIQRSSAKVFPPGSVGIAMYGATIGKLSIWAADLSTNQACAVAQPYQELFDTEFLYYFLLSQKRALIEAGKGGAQPNISQGILKAWPICLPPVNEQHRIVAKIEELFSELDKGVESLKTAQAQLKVYRQAVLKHAFEGKLTAQWREENKDKLETPEQLLARIKQEREARYEQQLQEWKAAVKKWEEGGKPSKKPSTPKKANELPPLAESELAELPRLPDGWGWVPLGNLGVDVSDGPFGSNLKSSDYVGNGIRVIRLENIGVLEFHNEKVSHITLKKYKTISKHSVTAGDIIVSSFVANGTRAVVLPDYIERAVNKADCFCIRSYGENLINSYIAMFLVTRCAYHQLGAQVHGATRPRINTTQLKNCAVPFISRNEQEQLVSELGEKLSLIKQLETDIEANLQKTATLRQSVLKKAFEGKLVPQDAHDEPASVLLDRIRTEREKTVQNNHSKKTKKRKTTA